MNYIEHAIRTESVISLSDININTRILHGCLGICTESIELLANKATRDRSNYEEELSDICWYLAIIHDELKLPFEINYEFFISDTIILKDIDPYIENLIINSSELIDLVKRQIYYKKEFSNDVIKNIMKRIIISINMICHILDFDIDQILVKNIEKLKKRYPDKFTEFNAINRDITNEMSVFK